MTEKGKEVSVYDRLGGNVEEEIKGYPIEDLKLLTTERDGRPTVSRCVENVYRIIDRHPSFAGRFRHDKWTQKNEIKDEKGWRELDDSDFVPIQRIISSMYPQFRNVPKEMTIDAIHDVCNEHSYDSAVDYLRGLPEWDGLDRLGIWIHQVYGASDDYKYHGAVGSNFFKGMVARILHPGCKFDSVLILEGMQGTFKSTSLSIIARDWHLETAMRAENKDFFLQFKGKLIVEFSEGETLSRTETKSMKAMISTRTDTYRTPYGRTMKDVPRRCVFAMTTNQEEYLKDESGNRRFYPVEVKQVADVAWLHENRDQLFAEALYRVEVLKETLHEYPDSAKEHQSRKLVSNQHEERIAEWLNHPSRCTAIERDGITVDEIWMNALMGDIVRMTKRDQMQIGAVLKKLGFEKERVQINGVQSMRWYLKGVQV